jgi:anti-sigma-K factor RskA
MNIPSAYNEDDEVLAAEYVLGVLDAGARKAAQARMQADSAFADLIEIWERRLVPLHEDIVPVEASTHVYDGIRRRLGWLQTKSESAGLWQSLNFWRGLAAAATFAMLALLLVRTPQAPMQQAVDEAQLARTVTTLAHADGSPGWLASVDVARGAVLMVPVPAEADPQGRVPELWLIASGQPARSLGIVSIDKSHTVAVPADLQRALIDGSVLAITLEAVGGAPGGVPAGPIIASGAIMNL